METELAAAMPLQVSPGRTVYVRAQFATPWAFEPLVETRNANAAAKSGRTANILKDEVVRMGQAQKDSRTCCWI